MNFVCGEGSDSIVDGALCYFVLFIFFVYFFLSCSSFTTLCFSGVGVCVRLMVLFVCVCVCIKVFWLSYQYVG